jgi:transposase-like protein
MERAEKLRNRRRKMGEYRKKYDEDFKKNAVKLSYASSKSVKEIADDMGIYCFYNEKRIQKRLGYM